LSVARCFARFKYAFWLDATNRETIEQSYKDIAAALCGSGTDDTPTSLEAAPAALASLSEEWLLLVDGADDASALSGLWPPGRSGNIVFTSRNLVLKDFTSDAVFVVAEMDDEAAVRLLLDAARLMPASDEVTMLAKGIVTKLGILALAIDQAGAYIARGECCVYDFLDTFELHRTSLLSIDAYNRAWPSKQSVYATWELSYSAIERKAAGERQQNSSVTVARNAIQLLNMLAYFHFEDVREDIFRRAAEHSGRSLSYLRNVDPHHELAGDSHLPHDLLPLRSDKRWDPQLFRKCIGLLTSFSLL
jgi:hypothetical protein